MKTSTYFKILFFSVFFYNVGCLYSQPISYWGGSNDTTVWTHGDGSIDWPYLIESAGNLACLAKRVNEGSNYAGVYFKLTTNINLGAANWVPIGKSTTYYFSGNFDGNNFIIDSLTFVQVATVNTFFGLFGVVQNSTIQNVLITNVNINQTSVSSTLYSGGISGATLGGDFINNCRIQSGNITSNSQTAGKAYAGGIIGFSQFGAKSIRISNCSNFGSISSNYAVGGIIGYSNVSSTLADTLWLTSCRNSGLIFGMPSSGNVYTGGIIGWLNLARNNTEYYVDNCYNTAYIKDSTHNGVYAYTGGIIGYVQNTASAVNNINVYISNSWNTGKVENINTSLDFSTNNWAYAGGITGNTTLYGIASVYYTNVYNDGDVYFKRSSPNTTSAVGGVMGLMSTQQAGCYLSLQGTYNTGKITLASPDTANILTYAGGIIGWLYNSGGQYTINQCLNTGNIESESYYSGGIIGYTGGFYTTGNVISNCFNSGNIHSKSTAGGITACYVHKVSGNSISNCISVGSITAEQGGASGIAGTLGDSTILNLATCYYDRQITGMTRAATLVGIGSGLLHDTLRFARQLAALQLNPSYWFMENDMYPRLLCFKDVDAMILAATPIYFYADPVMKSYNTYLKVNKSFGMGGKTGTAFYSDKPNVISIINNDSAVVNASANNNVKLTVSYGTQSRELDVMVVKEQEIYTSVCQGEVYSFLGRNINTSVPGDFVYYGVDSIIYVTVHPSYQHTDTISLCANELPLTYGDSVFTAGTLTGTYPVHFTLASGCDSLINVHLIINPIYNHTETLTICDSDLPIIYGNQIFNKSTVSGDYPVHFTLVSGCDSLVNLHLIVNSSYNKNETLTICSDELPLTYGDSVFPAGTISGIYPVHFTSIKGCDSLINLRLIVHPAYVTTDTLSICQDELPFTYGTRVFPIGTVTGNYQVHFTLGTGCDSLVNLHLIVLPTYSNIDSLFICDSELPVSYGNRVFAKGTTTGDFNIQFTTYLGCDSIVNLHLRVNPSYVNNQILTICSDELPLTYGDSVFPVGTISGIYPIHYTLPTGCDSLINLRLIVQPAYVTAETLTLCDNELPLYYGDSVFMIGTLSGTYPVHYTLPGGCDSLVNLHLIVHPTYYDVDNVTICTSDLPLTYGDTVFYPGTSSGTYFISYLTSKGCDSVITLNLQVNQAYYFMDTVSLCDCDFPYTYMDTTFLEGTLDGDYVFNHTTSNGCDSIYSLTLYIHSTYSYTENATICAYDAYYWHGKTYNQTGVYYDSLKTKHSDCDSVFRLNLTVNDVYVTLDTITFCSNELPLEYQGKFIDRPGDYYISFTANNGCDSLVSLNVKLNQAYDTIVVAHVTKTKLPYVFGSQLLTDAGTYSELFKSVEFCDSLVHLVLVVGDLGKDTVYGNDTKKICVSDLPYTYGTRVFPEGTKSGAYDIAFTTLEGKDSILTLYLSILNIPSAPDSIIGLDKINMSGKYAYSVNPVEGADQYRWGISNNMFVFEDETNTSNNAVLYVALSGDAILSVAAGNQCGYSADISMQILSSVSIVDSYKDVFNVKLYPNPVQDNVYIDIEGDNAVDEIVLMDIYGKTIDRKPVRDSHLQWDVSALANGIYFLQFKAGKEIIGSYKIIRHK